MAIHDFNAQRLFVDGALSTGATIPCTSEQANYLRNVLRLDDGSEIRIFNGRDGEWLARLAASGKRSVTLEAIERLREQESGPDIDYLFAPLKRARLDYMVQKATELGVARLRPVFTQHTVVERVNLDRMRANAIEAAEQCGILRIPEVFEPVKLEDVLRDWNPLKTLVFCDESANRRGPVVTLTALRNPSLGLLIGPEGGFSAKERELILGFPFTVQLSLGPRIMRADTAAIAALAVINAVVGDWHGQS